ncbi:hypothetical protein M413DRAFT_372330 [Hebeloma cylindrosporum]|uniref:Uncharacterized protein n=1 Tax=Hebeloma cylindrosporum TaxID=76867 RepID=A0A0C2YSF5_HEBCY|nr:hypothetical protein M413DRAFT_372330 [Hebeloma cylindrosporum h7]
MTDLTVLVSPLPLYPETRDFTFGRRTSRPLSKPIMVTLETEIDEAEEADQRKPQILPPPVDTDFISPTSPPRRSRTPRVVDSNLLSPPVNTWKSRPRHRPTRSQSAPPERRIAAPEVNEDEREPESATFNHEALGFVPRSPTRSFAAFKLDRQTTRGGELVRPPPPLLRPTTFWRKTRRSGVTGASYSPASHLIRRSTYIAAGLAFDAPVHDLSALCVESRVGFIVIPPDQSLL